MTTEFALSPADAHLLQAFESCELTSATFRHREHLRLAHIYLTLHPFEIALQTLRSRLQAFLAHLGAPPTAYHETMTRAWLLAVAHFMRQSREQRSSEDFLSTSPALLNKEVMYTHYTPERLKSSAAREGFVEPDLEPIPLRGEKFDIGAEIVLNSSGESHFEAKERRCRVSE
jgi:hypothetical protein